jgi:2-keto-4-pentenoate hydratase/2-oxohepta-3-ene-1,7-dioic acid hydratase in catechol pathway
MHLARYRDDGQIHVGVIVGEEVGAVGSLGLDPPDDIPAILAGGSERREQLARQIDRSANRQPLAQVELLAPIPRPGKFLAAGMNYATHAAELRDPPRRPPS